VWFGIVGRVLQKSLAFLCEREYTWSCNLMRIAIWGLTCGTEKSSQQFHIILQPAVRFFFFAYKKQNVMIYTAKRC
jgi:hypothetical protein